MSNNYIDLLPGIPSQIHIETHLPAEELKNRLTFQTFNQLHSTTQNSNNQIN
ncbi:MAG: hypothetical protein MJZ41_15580 [Bacteroidaceae bacterium]|nr:hypothetical protein [Bacteroidaceae bacterium]